MKSFDATCQYCGFTGTISTQRAAVGGVVRNCSECGANHSYIHTEAAAHTQFTLHKFLNGYE